MEISSFNKQDILNGAIEAKAGAELERDIRAVIDRFRKYKKVDKRFTDALCELGYHAFIINDILGKKLIVRKKIDSDLYVTTSCNRSIEFYVYRELTWEAIEKELERYDYIGKIREYEKKDRKLKFEIEEVKKILATLESKDFTCFAISRLKRELERALDYATKI